MIERDCWWIREAMSHPEFRGEPTTPLAGDTTADVVIVGGGYTGLWTAWQLTRMSPGIDVVVLEQDQCGFGPSGRNGGFVNGFHDYTGPLIDLFGVDDARAVVNAGDAAVTDLAAWMDEYDVDAWYRPDGCIAVASSPRQVGGWDDAIKAAQALGVADRYELLDRDALGGYVRSPVFEGGMRVSDGGTLHPARLARGLRRVCLEAGVRIHEHTPAEPISDGAQAQVVTPRGTVQAGQVVVGANAWMASWPGFRRSVVARATYIAITDPAPEILREINWTTGVGVFDLRSALRYLRTTPDGRIALGVGGERGSFNGRISRRFDWDQTGTSHAVEAIHHFFPEFRDVPIAARWGGPIDMSPTHLPTAGTLPGGLVHYAMGYTGNGVGPTYLMGQILAAKALGRQTELTALPIVDRKVHQWPPQPFRGVGASIVNAAIVRRDNALDAGRRANPVATAVAGLPSRLGYRFFE